MRPAAAAHPRSKQRLCPSQMLLFRVRFPCCATQCHQKPLGSPLSPASPGSAAWPTLLRAPPITCTSRPHQRRRHQDESRGSSPASVHGLQESVESTSCTLELDSPASGLVGSLGRCQTPAPMAPELCGVELHLWVWEEGQEGKQVYDISAMWP